MAELFDYRALANRIGVSGDQLQNLEAALRRQYGTDEMMFELRMLRTLRAIEDGTATVLEAIEQLSSDAVRTPANM